MSHSSGNVTFKKDNLVMHCEYDGTCDVMVPALWDTEEEMSQHWRESVWNKCTCGNMEPVIIHSAYGGGFSWEGEACRTCKAINHEHLELYWKEDKEYEEQRRNPWGMMTEENAKNFSIQVQSEGIWAPMYKEVQNIKVEPQEGVISPFYPFSGSVTLENIELSDIAKALFDFSETLPPMDLVVRNVHVREGAKPLRSHKKRLVKKWTKKNIIIEDETLFKNCTIIGGDL